MISMKKPTHNSSTVLSVDIGNSTTRAAIVDTGSLICVKKISIPNTAFDDCFGFELDSLLAGAPKRICHVNISSCIKDLYFKSSDICHEKGLSEINLLSVHESLPVPFLYHTVSNLGTDRIADALASNRLYKGHNCLIVDSGTAITIDILDKEKGFLGGAILPGIKMQLDSLSSNTDKLPRTDLSSGNHTLPGTSTESCIMSGVLYGTAGAITIHVRHFTRRFEDLRVIGTGGAWELTQHLLDFDYVYNQDLTLLGTALYVPSEGKSCIARLPD